ncbi:hypothetical protein [Luteolibacter marinus]|uniref:hypothetical protein n=1 Tax=Luteolibacter marinus TaxID=2776705 RepID=UPI001D010D40|nr:hypothetical protein [Luteolibacter marinus]
MNVGLILPMFFEFSRAIRDGVLDWVDQHPGWRVIELDPTRQQLGARFLRHLDGAITWLTPAGESWPHEALAKLPVIDCGIWQSAGDDRAGLAAVSFDRDSTSRLAIRHFADLGLEIAGYAGFGIQSGGVLVPRVANMRAAVLEAGLQWVQFDLGDPASKNHPEWVLESARI